jgi:uncharacterized repeat protein (TIGR03803 family)
VQCVAPHFARPSIAFGVTITLVPQLAFSQTYNYSTIYNFTGGADGFQVSGIYQGPAGHLYATTDATYDNPPSSGNGAIVELAAGTHAVSIVDSLPSGAGLPAIPEGPFYFDQHGNLYGLSVYGGPNNAGTFFEIPSGSHSATVLTSFTGSNGDNPFAPGLTSDSTGNIYATTFFGGIGYTGTINTGFGTLFKIAAGTNSITDLVQFNGTDGKNPGGNLLMDSSGDIFGITEAGGTNNDGTLYELPAGSTTLRTLFNFANADAYPGGGVITDSQGNFYGVTSGTLGGGVGGYGTIFKFNINTKQFTTLFTFDGTDGGSPGGQLYLSPSGNLIGTAGFNGLNGLGNIFEFNPQTEALTILHSFDDANGSTDGIFPSGLVADPQGNLYGVGGHGGLYGEGTIFELTAVPEPRTAALLALMGTGLIMRRSSRGKRL